MNRKFEYITGLYYQYMGERRQLLVDLDKCIDDNTSDMSRVSGIVDRLGVVDNNITTLQREFPDILRQSQAAKPAEG